MTESDHSLFALSAAPSRSSCIDRNQRCAGAPLGMLRAMGQVFSDDRIGLTLGLAYADSVLSFVRSSLV
jgi:hypothetical protein